MRALADFEGRWRVAREIDDRYAGRRGRFEGTVIFVPEAGGLRYHEAGELIMDGVKPMAATRDYIWSEGEDGIEVFFDDGRPFHTIGTMASHWCDPDRYDVAYDFSHWPDWQATWEVQGPRKDYRMESRYGRISP